MHDLTIFSKIIINEHLSTYYGLGIVLRSLHELSKLYKIGSIISPILQIKTN